LPPSKPRLSVLKVYSPESKADAVALYLSNPGHTFEGIGKDLGISRETLLNRAAGRAGPPRQGQHDEYEHGEEHGGFPTDGRRASGRERGPAPRAGGSAQERCRNSPSSGTLSAEPRSFSHKR